MKSHHIAIKQQIVEESDSDNDNQLIILWKGKNKIIILWNGKIKPNKIINIKK